MHAKLFRVMGAHILFLNRVVTAFLSVVAFSLPLAADESVRLDQLFAQLQEADPQEAGRIAREIELEWSKSGSPAMDLLLKRGTDAFEAGDSRAAVEHFTALTDHAPGFAQGWHMRSLAYAELGLFGPALADIERALALQPRHYNAIASLGGILAEIDRPDMAIEAFEQVLAIHPHHQDVSEALEHLQRVDGSADL